MQNLPIRESGVFCSGSSVNTRCASHRGTNVVFTSVHVTRAVRKQGTLKGHFNLQRYITCAPITTSWCYSISPECCNVQFNLLIYSLFEQIRKNVSVCMEAQKNLKPNFVSVGVIIFYMPSSHTFLVHCPCNLIYQQQCCLLIFHNITVSKHSLVIYSVSQ